MKVAIVSGGVDPIHVGHVELLNKASRLADGLVVILNTDEFLKEKKGKPFMKFEERKVILENIRCVDLVIKSIDIDQTVCKTLQKLAEMRIILPNGEPHEHLLFCNGGDRTNGENTPEHLVCQQVGIESIYGLGDKIQSSSWLTQG